MKREEVNKRVDKFVKELQKMGVRDAIVVVGLDKKNCNVSRISSYKTKGCEVEKFIRKIWKLSDSLFK